MFESSFSYVTSSLSADISNAVPESMKMLVGIGLVVFGCVIGSFAALLLKFGAADFSLNPLKLIKNWKFLLGGFLYFLSTFPFLLGLKFADLTILYPFVSTSYIWVIFLSMYFLKERMNIWKWSGIFAIIVGVTMIGLGKG